MELPWNSAAIQSKVASLSKRSRWCLKASALFNTTCGSPPPALCSLAIQSQWQLMTIFGFLLLSVKGKRLHCWADREATILADGCAVQSKAKDINPAVLTAYRSAPLTRPGILQPAVIVCLFFSPHVKPSDVQCIGQWDQPWPLPRGWLPPALPSQSACTGLPSGGDLNGPDVEFWNKPSLVLTLE